MTFSTRATAVALTFFLAPVTGCAVESAPTSSASQGESATAAAPAAKGEVKPDGLFGAQPTLSANLTSTAIDFTGSSFDPNATVSVGVYTPDGAGGWLLQSEEETLTASPLTCARFFCVGGGISGAIPWTRGCAEPIAVRAFDWTAQQWASAPIAVCETPSVAH
jgi:hypothetical protein